ncbi:MAG: MarR family transcriptional regulator [Pseudonocardiales bacterium]
MRVAEARLRPLGLGVAHMPVLIALAREGSLTQKEIAQRTHVEQPTAAALLQRMDAAGLTDRSPNPSDRRSTRISLSARAAALLPEALGLRQQTVSAATAGLSATDVELLNDLLGRVLANLDMMVEGSG